MKKYKYKREHFDTQEQYEAFKRRNTKSRKTWLNKRELLNPELRERRIIRQRLYSRYYWSGSRHTFAEWLLEEYGIESISTIPIDRLREKASIIPGPYGVTRNKMPKNEEDLSEEVNPSAVRQLASL